MSDAASSLPAVLDWFVVNVRGLPVVGQPVLDSDGWIVSDGWPDEQVQAQIIIGSTAPGGIVDGGQTSAGTGIPHPRDEDYSFTIEIHAATGTTDQKIVRDAVFTVHDAISALVNTDSSLEGLLTTQGAQLGSMTLEQTDEERADDGRFAILTDTVHVRNRIRPVAP